MVDAPFGYTKGGKPKAPYGYTKSGRVRRQPSKRTYIQGRGDYKIGRTYMRGRGGYISDFAAAARPYTKGWASRAGTAAGAAIGGGIGTLVAPGISSAAGAGMGGALGGALGRKFAQLTGWGDYAVKSNTLIHPNDIVPSFGEDSIRVRKRECIGHISASSSFVNNSFPINPGLSDTFPWLSAIATNYAQYRFNGLVFQFESTSSDAIASTTDLGLGQVILATNYDAEEAAFVNDLQMLGSTFANSAKPSENIMHAVECAPTDTAQKLYYVRSGDPPAGADLRLYDLGTFQLATINMPSAYEGLGRIWVSYDVTFCKSVMNNQLGYDINTDEWTVDASTITSLSAPLGTTHTLDTGSNLGTTINTAGTVLSFPPTIESGYYSLFMYWSTGAGAAGAFVSTSAQTNCTVVKGFSNSGTTTTRCFIEWIVRIDDRDASIDFTGLQLPSTVASTPGSCTFVITQVNGEIDYVA